jgi:hypothetical protein
MQTLHQANPGRTGRPVWAAPAAALCLAVLFSACKKESSKAVVLAQVGNSTLTLDELRESFPAEYEQLIRREQYLDFIKRWIDDEVVYQQALKSRLDDDPQIKRKVERLRRKLLIEEFLSRENAAEVFEPDEMAMNQYYEMHKEDFRRKVPEFKFVSIRVQGYKQAMDVRNHVNGENFLALAATNSLDPTPESIASLGFKKLTEIPPCLAQDIATARIGAVTLPIACPDGMYLVKMVERQEAGSVIPFAEAKEEISGTLIMERKDKLMDQRIANYKEGMAVSYNLDQIPGLAETPAGHEGADAAPAPAPEAPHAAPAHAGSPRAVLPHAAVAAPAAAPATAPAAPRPAVPVSAPAQNAAAPAALPANAKPPVSGAPAATPRPAEAPAVDPRLPREPWEIPPDAPPAKPKRPKRRHIDSTAAPSAPASGAENLQEKSNAQTPDSQ